MEASRVSFRSCKNISTLSVNTCRRIQTLVLIIAVISYLVCISYVELLVESDSNYTVSNETNNISTVDEVEKQNHNDDTVENNSAVYEWSEDYDYSFNQYDEINLELEKCDECVRRYCSEYSESIRNLSCVFENNEDNLEEIHYIDPLLGNGNKNNSDSKSVFSNSTYIVFFNTCSIENLHGDEQFNKIEVLVLNNSSSENKTFLNRTEICVNFLSRRKYVFTIICCKLSNRYEGNLLYEETTITLLENMKEIIPIILTVTSSLCTLTTLVIYAYLPQLRNVHGKILICYLMSVFIFHIMLYILIVDNKGSATLELIREFSLLSWLTWITVMSYDIWSTFNTPLALNQNRKMMSYYLTGIGAPVICILLKQCLGVIVMLPAIQLTMILNIMFFFSTLINLHLQRLSHKQKQSSLSRRHGKCSREGIVLYLKLSLLMGLDWLIFWLSVQFGNKMHFYLSLLFMEMQGIFLFISLVCNKRVFRFLREKWHK